MTVKQWRSLHQPLALACALAIFFPNTVNVQAQPAFPSSSYPSPQSSPPNRKYGNRLRKVARLKFTLPPKGAPGRRTDAASRSGCPVLSQPVTALVPPTNIGLTLAERPTFWFNIPYQPNSNSLRKFQLLDEEETVVYETFPGVETSGIVDINLANPLPTVHQSACCEVRQSARSACQTTNHSQHKARFARVEFSQFPAFALTVV